MNKQDRVLSLLGETSFCITLVMPKGPERHQTPMSPVVWTHTTQRCFGLSFVTSLCTDGFPPLTATTHDYNMSTKGESTACQLVEMEQSFLSEPHTLCDLGTDVFLHQNLQPNKISVSLSVFRSPSCLCLYPHLHSRSLPLCLSLLISFFPSLRCTLFQNTFSPRLSGN